MRMYRAFVAVCLCALFASNAFASADWLLSQQRQDGSIAAADVATPFQSTAEAVTTLRLLGSTNVGAAQAYLDSQSYHGTEYLSRKIGALATAGVPTGNLVAELIIHQNADGGFGEHPGYQSTALDTAFALEAIAASGNLQHVAAGYGVGYLLQIQRADGSWAVGELSDLYTTALVARAMHPFRNRFTAVPSAVANAGNFILSRRTADALWGEDYESAQALLSLSAIAADVVPFQASSSALRAHRLANTSWSNDVYVTAVALRALYVFDARAGGATIPETGGAITGYVLRAGTSAPIEGATVAAANGAQAQTNSEGHFALSGIQAGDRTLTVSRSGYASATRAVTVRNGQFSNAGTILLGQSSQYALVRGHIADAHDSNALAGVAITLSGPSNASATSNAQGEFEIADLPAGSYTVRFARQGYYTATGVLDAPLGSITSIQQALTREGAFLDESPVDVGGRVVDGLSGMPVAGAALLVDGQAAGTSAADGQFELDSLARGNHRLDIAFTGYAAASYTFILAPGAAGALGDLALFAATQESAPTTLTLSGTVVNGLDNRPLAGASVQIVQSGNSIVTSEQGRFVLSGMTTLAFDVIVTAPGYETRTFGVAASGFGEVAGTFALPPLGGDPLATASVLRGLVRDSVTTEPLANVSLRIAGTAAAAVSAADGSFEIGPVARLEFALSASLSGYAEGNYGVELGQHGTYAMDIVLTREPGAVNDLFDVVSVVPTQTGIGAHSQQLFAARVTNLASEARTALIVADVFDATDAIVGSTTPFAIGTQTPATLFSFAAAETLDLTIPWNTAQFAPGTYRVRVRVIEPGTVTRDLPSGVVLAQGGTVGSVSATQAIAGGLALDPPLAQAGSSQPVRLSALLINQGNVPLTGQTFTLSVLDPVTAATLHSAQAQAAMLEVGNSTTLDFGVWTPTQAGDLPVTVTADAAETTGMVNGMLYVGDKATGTFTVDRSVVPMGTQTVRASIAMRGVDLRTGTSTDPLFLAVKEAVRKGGLYVSQQAPLWNEQNRCLGCHTQTQSIMGLIASVDKAEIDLGALKYLYNDILGSQQADGALYASHPQHASVSNSLAVWSLSTAPDTQRIFRTMYRASSFQLSRLSTSGNQSWWGNDHCGAWWCNTEGPTMAATKGIAGTLRMAAELGSQTVPDYALEAAHEHGAVNLMDFEQTSDGTLWYVEYGGGLYAKDLQTGVRRTVATGITNAYGLAVRDDGVAYVTTGSRVVRVNADGTRSDLVNVGANSNLLDIIFGADGFLYVADFNNHRILKISEAGSVTTFASGGLFSQPVGLAFDPQGDLYVANFGRFNILRISSAGAVSVFAPGLPYRPVWLRRSADGTFYANSEQYNNNGVTPSGIWRIDSNGFAERIATSGSTNLYGYNGMNFIGNELYLGHESSRRLYRVTSQPLATPQLPAMRAALERVMHFTLARYTDNGQWNDLHAMRLITLAEARPYVTDSALLTQIDTAISSIETLLRQRQRADGGWAYIVSRTVSDPYATAFVGLALEYTHPSVNDPAVRNSITYLLNQQQSDFSWNYQTGVFPTKLGPTSFVMAYLPLALERLGGIDTDLSVVLPANVQLSNPSQAPSSQSAASGGTLYRWSLQGVTANARTISFDATLANLGYQEERAVAAQAYLEFNNSFNGETLHSDLTIPKVRAASDLVLTLNSGQGPYGAQSDVAINSLVTNAGPPVTSGTLHLVIRAADGTVVTDLGTSNVGALATGASISLPAIWNTGAILAGGYKVYGQLYNAASALVSEATTSLQVVPTGTVTTAGVSVDKPVYQAWDSVALAGRIRNASQNAIQANSTAKFTIFSPAGQPIFERSFAVAELAPLALRDVISTLNLVDAVSGTYSVALVVRDAFSNAVLATASAGFDVQRDELQALRGNVTVQATRVERGTANVCMDTVTNVAAAALPGVVLTQTVSSLQGETTVQSAQLTRDFAGGQQHVVPRSVATGALTPGGYICALTATYQGRTHQLGAAAFEVTVPAIKLEATLTSEGRGRLLVLMDQGGGWPCTSLRDIELWAPFRTRLPANARIDVELVDSEGNRVDFESVALSKYRGTVNQRSGTRADLSIVGASADVLTVKIASSAGLGEGYRMVVTATADSLPPIVVTSNVMGENCGWHAGHGARFGDFHCAGGHSRNGEGLPPPVATLPTLVQQRAFLEEELRQAGWSFKIVTDDESFERELRTGQYSQYALLSEHEKLDEQVQKELREAVYRGEGLLDAGQHDHRHHSFDAALGIVPQGRHAHAAAVNVQAPWSANGTVGLHLGSEALKVRLNGAQEIATFPGVYGYDTAAASYSYGRGKSVYVGYDLLAEATYAGSGSLHAALLRNALTQVAPTVSASPRTGEVIPLRLTVNNRAVATAGRALLPLPAGVTLVDAGEAQFSNGTLSWTFNLAANQAQTFSVWVRLPNAQGSVRFDATVQAGSGPSYSDQAHPSLTLQTTARATLTQARALAQTNIRFLSVRFWLEKAQFWLDRGCEEFALASLVQASDEVINVSHAQSAQLRLQINEAIWTLSTQIAAH